MITFTFDKVMRGLPFPVDDGKSISYSLPAGCVLLRDGVVIDTPSPFVHSGGRAEYRIDCVVYAGTPVTATFSP